MLRKIKELIGIGPIADHRVVHTISIYFPDGFRSEEVEKFGPILETSDAYNLLQPSSINLFFACVDGAEEKIMKVTSGLDSIARDQTIRHFYWGDSRGECLGEFDSKGLLASTPLGDVITEASRKAWGQEKTA